MTSEESTSHQYIVAQMFRQTWEGEFFIKVLMGSVISLWGMSRVKDSM